MRPIAALLAVFTAALASGPAQAQQLDGAALYDRYCLPCHGSAGDGQGPASPWLWPRPRDFTRGDYRWRTTTSGSFPTDVDLAATIRFGVPGTSMLPFAGALTEPQIDSVVGYLKTFTPKRHARSKKVMELGVPPAVTPSIIERGRAVYTELGCAACHGEAGKGDGPSAAELTDAAGLPAQPYDLTARPMRRPRAPGTELTAIYTSLMTGMDGTPMPSFAEALPEADLWAVSAFVETLLYRAGANSPPQPEPTSIAPIAIKLSRPLGLRPGYWPGSATDADAQLFAGLLTFPGPAPDALGPAQASLQPAQCGRCHDKQLREWRGSLHAKAASPGLIGQAMRAGDAGAESCYRCHAPLAEQQPRIRPGHSGGDPASNAYRTNPLYDEQLRNEGLACAACHVRNWRRLGPPRNPSSGLLAGPSYPVEVLPIFQRSDLCLGCHQLPPSSAVNGKPMLNTYREWLEGPYMRRGIQCQHCHMPNREHRWLGVHDPETFRQGISLAAIAGRSTTTGAVSVRARVTNVGAGHYLPTTPTPAAFLQIDLLDSNRAVIEGASDELRIGRHIEFRGGRFHELEDTRIPPGQSIELARAWKDGRVAEARWARIRVWVEPDNYYQGLFEARLRTQKLSPAIRALFEAALARTLKSKFVALERLVPL